ncbi:1-phosphofructokinase [Puniceicoccus vermicola]|uniref:1-phosphofructokinase n=1 Tax=Puniceicoccus vermicola TaxID=388746 RepID=A0A7X1AZL0_9BACT|nr:1-phosphofructokinase [Puniceicoccus vermicola]MBC2602896.1 1-phosphofructokinase [Puniceicoccus vermicola]
MKTIDFTTITLNPAVDHTLFVDGMTLGSVNRAIDFQRQAGGKGINVATMLALGGATVAVSGFLGRNNPSIFDRHFRDHGLLDHFIRVGGETRTGIKIVDTKTDETTDINLNGPAAAESQQAELLAKVKELVRPGKWVVIAGSMPKGVAPEFIGELIRVVHSGEGLVAVDSSGAALKAAMDAGADLAKPNEHELAEYFNKDLRDFDDLVHAARSLQKEKVANLVVSLGSEGVLFLTPESEWKASAPNVKVVSTVGAGDSMMAGFLRGLADGETPEDCARMGTVYAWNRLESLLPKLPSGNVLKSQMRQIAVQPLTEAEAEVSSLSGGGPRQN